MVSKQQIELAPENTQHIHSASSRAVPKAGEFERLEIKEILSHQVIESSQTE